MTCPVSINGASRSPSLTHGSLLQRAHSHLPRLLVWASQGASGIHSEDTKPLQKSLERNVMMGVGRWPHCYKRDLPCFTAKHSNALDILHRTVSLPGLSLRKVLISFPFFSLSLSF